MDQTAAATRVGFLNGKMTFTAPDENGVNKSYRFCDRYWQVMGRIRTIEGTWQLEIGYEQYAGQPHKTFYLDSAAVTAPDMLRKEFSARELHLFGGKRGMDKAQALIRYQQTLQYENAMETSTHSTMGWVSVDGAPRGEPTGDFVIGDTLFSPNQPPRKILLEDTMEQNLKTAFKTRGTTAEWCHLIDYIYNRPGAEAYQFVIAAMFAAPLTKLMPGDGEWHGIPLVLSGESGAAKTSTALVAMSIYAQGQMLRFSAQGGKGGQGDTINALSIKAGTLRSIPFIMDEMTGAEPEKVSDIMYMLANGKSKDRMGKDGKMVYNPYCWDVISIATSNESLHEILRGLRNADSAEATQMRSFQVWLRNDLNTIFHGVGRTLIEDNLLGQQYGCVGRDWIQFVVNNRPKIEALLGDMRKKYMVDPKDKSQTRFYKDLLITVYVAAKLAARKQFIQWDVDKMMKWAEAQFVSLRDEVATRDWAGTISDFVASLHGRTIVTKNMSLRAGRRSTKNLELPLEPLTTAQPPVARKAIDDKIFVVTANALNEWCRTNKVLPSAMLNAMVAMGFLAPPAGVKVEPRLINIGSGSSATRPQAPCYELNFDRVSTYQHGDDQPAADNVVQFPTVSTSVTGSVTTGTDDSEDASVSP